MNDWHYQEVDNANKYGHSRIRSIGHIDGNHDAQMVVNTGLAEDMSI